MWPAKSCAIFWLGLACWLASCAVNDAPRGPATLTGVDRYITDSGEQQVAISADDVLVFAIGTAGNMIELTVEDGPQGLIVADAPAGTYYIMRGQILVETQARSVDIGMVVLGRSDATPPAQPTSLSLLLSNMDPWQDGDALMLYSAGAGLWSDYRAIDEPAVDPTQTELSLSFAQLPGVDSNRGDRLYVTQFRDNTIAGHTYRSALRSQVATIDMTLPDPQVAVALDGPATLESQPVTWRISEFDAARQDVQPIAITAFYDFYLAAMPDGARYGQYGAAADLVSMRAQDIQGDLSGSFSYADPYPTEWTRIATIVAWYPVTYTLANASRTTLWDGVWTRAQLTGDAIDAAPFVGPPTGVDMEWTNGLCVRWDPPVTGAASSYQLTIYYLVDEGGSSRLEPAVGARTKRTQICIANDLLDATAGGIVVQVGGVFGPDGADTAPFATTLPYGYAETSQLAPPRP